MFDFYVRNFKKNSRVCVALIAALFLYGCEIVPKAQDGETLLSKFDARSYAASYAEYNERQKKWLINGKFSFSSPLESGQGRYKWNRVNDGVGDSKSVGKSSGKDEMRLFGPFGAGAALIKVEEGFAEISTGKETYSAKSVESLSEEVFGWVLPFEGLHYWLFGLPVPTQGALIAFNERGEIRLLQQAGWEVEFSGEASVISEGEAESKGGELLELKVPKKIKATHAASSTKVKMIISKIRF